MDKAQKILEAYKVASDKLKQAGGNLRFGLAWVKVSEIGKQYYCEKAVELSYQYPIEPTEEMIRGDEGHENITALTYPVFIEDAIRVACQKGKKAEPFENVPIIWEHKGVPIIGEADRVWFSGGSVYLLEERKFSSHLHVYRPYHVQAKVYCLGLEAMGFDATTTKYRIVVFKQSCHDCVKLVSRSCPIFDPANKEYRCDKGEAKAFISNFDREDALKDLDWALDLWLMKREAKPTTKSYKCAKCGRHTTCPNSLVRSS